ncbi:hypothetical protein H6801_01585 [Candidatus Nomurabacteria bacterium]|nr:hypothetical protein [Candidatus Nomurabacteria bacterium]
MIATNHALTGAVIAVVIKQPVLAIPLAFTSHFICDAIPHFGVDLKFNSRAMYVWLILDGLFALSAAGFLLWYGVESPVLLAMCGFVAMSPDFGWLYYGLNNKLGKVVEYDTLTKIHHIVQWYQKVPGIIIEVSWATLMIYIIIRAQTI